MNTDYLTASNSPVAGFAAHWKSRKLGDVFETKLGKMLSPKAKHGNAPRPYMRNANVQWGYFDLSDVQEMDFSADEFDRFALRNGDILVCEGGEVGRTAVWSDEIPGCCYQKAIHRLRPRDGAILPDFFTFFMLQAFRYRRTYGVPGTETTIAHLPAEKLQWLDIPVPPIAEQRAIAAVLGKLQAAVAAQQAIIDRTAELKAALMAKLFKEGARGEALKESNIGLIPRNWQLRNPREIFALASGDTRPEDMVQTPETGAKYPVVGGNGVMGYSSHFNSESITLVIGRVGEKCGCVHVTGSPAWITDNALFAKNWVADDVPLQWVAEYLTFLNLNQFKKKSGQPLVTQGIVYEHWIPVPDDATETADIITALGLIASREAVSCRQRALQSELFATMLDELMTGRIRVNELDLAELGDAADA